MLCDGAWSKGFGDREIHGASTVAQDRTQMRLMKEVVVEYLVAQHSRSFSLDSVTSTVIHSPLVILPIIGLYAGRPSVAGGTILYPSLVDLADACFETRRAGT